MGSLLNLAKSSFAEWFAYIQIRTIFICSADISLKDTKVQK